MIKPKRIVVIDTSADDHPLVALFIRLHVETGVTRSAMTSCRTGKEGKAWANLQPKEPDHGSASHSQH